MEHGEERATGREAGDEDPELAAYIDELRRKVAEDAAAGPHGRRSTDRPTLGGALFGPIAATGVLAIVAVIIVLALALYVMGVGPR